MKQIKNTNNNNNKSKRIVVMGAGPSGLVAVKELLAQGFNNVVCIEKSSGIGGAFGINSAYDSMYLTISNLFMSYSDYPPPRTIEYSTKQEYLDYLEDYTKHFGLRRCIEFNTEIVRAKLTKGGDGNGGTTTKTWRITVKSNNPRQEGPKERDLIADVFIVASGSNHNAKWIDLPGFTGTVSHSSQYKGPKDYADKRVLVVGVGESSSDMASEIAEVADRVTLWARKHIVLAPRYLGPVINDPQYNEMELLQTQKERKKDVVNDFLEIITTSRLAGWLPLWYYGWIRNGVVWNIKTTPQGEANRFGLIADWSKIASADHYYQADQCCLTTKNGNLSVAHALGKLDTIVSKTVEYQGNQVTFPQTIWFNEPVDKCERTITADHILLCTGYKTDFSWLEIEKDGVDDEYVFDPSPRSWYKHCFPAKYGDQLMFLGWTRPHQGGIPACSEMLSRYIALLLSGDRELPSDYAEIAKREGGMETAYYGYTPDVSVLMDLPAFMESLSKLIGCTPQCPSLLWNTERFVQYWVYPAWPCWYRQRGPGAKPEAIDQVYDELPLKERLGLDPVLILSIPMAVATYSMSVLIRLIPLLGDWYCKRGFSYGFLFRPKKHILHGNDIPRVHLVTQISVLGLAAYMLMAVRA